MTQQRKKVISYNFKRSVADISIFLDPYLNLKEADFREVRNLLLYIRKVNKEQFVVDMLTSLILITAASGKIIIFLGSWMGLIYILYREKCISSFRVLIISNFPQFWYFEYNLHQLWRNLYVDWYLLQFRIWKLLSMFGMMERKYYAIVILCIKNIKHKMPNTCRWQDSWYMYLYQIIWKKKSLMFGPEWWLCKHLFVVIPMQVGLANEKYWLLKLIFCFFTHTCLLFRHAFIPWICTFMGTT